MKKVFLFDLDDTLMWNEYTYSLATIEFLEFLIRIFNHRLPFVGHIARRVEEISYELINEINPRTGKPYKFSMNRFPETLIRCYKELCENGWGEFNSQHAEHIEKIGLKAFDEELYRKNGFVRDALYPVIYKLKERGDVLILLTKGDPEVQERKIRALKLRDWMYEVKIVEEKTPELFLEYKDRFKNAKVFSIGNSFSSDIKPALEAGISAIFIPCFTWKAESLKVGKLPPNWQKRFWQIREIGEIIKIYSKLEGAVQ